MKYLLALLLVAMPITANAKIVRLGFLSIDDVRAKCTLVGGVFFDRSGGGSYGCQFAKGLVQCDAEQRCIGYPRQRLAPQPTPPQPPQEPWQWQYRDRW
jgi:hypothetical protein